jgi:hypothetical protein
MRADIEKICADIQEVETRLASPEDREPYRAAALALTFIQYSGHLCNFEDYLDCLGRVVAVSGLFTFETRQEAEAWLRSHSAPERAAMVVIASIRYSVAYSPQSGARFLIRTPPWEELSSVRRTTSPDMDRSLAALYSARERTGSPELTRSINTAVAALHFIWEGGLVSDFEDYLRRCKKDVPLPALRTFSTREEAEAWLNEHPRPPHFAPVEIAGQRYSVGYSRDRGIRALVRSPRREELGPLEEPDQD